MTENKLHVPKLVLGLVHYPIIDREKRTVATNITNFDIHDIARATTVYGVQNYYLIHPNQEQLMFVDRVLNHWRVGQGAQFNPSRKVALQNVKTAKTLDEALADWGYPREKTLVIGTHARPVEGTKHWTIPELRKTLQDPEMACFLIFGTGYGLTDEFMRSTDGILESIRGAPPKDFRHLSVRSAVSIYLDRIMGPW